MISSEFVINFYIVIRVGEFFIKSLGRGGGGLGNISNTTLQILSVRGVWQGQWKKMQAQSSIHHNHFSLKLFHPYNKFITGCVFSISLNPLVSFAGLFSATFYHRVFSNVSSNGLPEMMHSHIGYICVTFLQCAFSNVSSNCLPERMHNHIGCIFLTSWSP